MSTSSEFQQCSDTFVSLSFGFPVSEFHNKMSAQVSSDMSVFPSVCSYISQEKPLNKSLQRGEDPQFDQVCMPYMDT